jgi:hypothetical protein
MLGFLPLLSAWGETWLRALLSVVTSRYALPVNLFEDVLFLCSKYCSVLQIWVQSDSSKPNNERNNSGWRCQSVGSYK